MKHYTKYKLYCYMEILNKVTFYVTVSLVAFCVGWGVADIITRIANV